MGANYKLYPLVGKGHGAWNYSHDTVKVQNLKVLKVIADQNLLVVKGCVPGHKNAYLKIEK